MATATIQRSETTWELREGELLAPGVSALRLLGGGTRYEAYLAFDGRLHHTVVVKVLRPELLGDDHALHGLQAEAEILKTLNHPAIARLLRDATGDERPHIVLEHVEGPRLSTLIRRFGPLETEQAAPLALEIASALHYMHGRGLVHLDVKPKNLIMGAPPRLIDLSIARSFDDAATLTTPVGTDAYMAPEQAAAPAPGLVGPAADVWGLGATLYEALGGRPAFPRGSDDAHASAEGRFPQLTHRPEPLPRHIPQELSRVTSWALESDPSDRPTAKEVAEAVEPLLGRPRRMVLNRLKPR
jgi:serine/threonine-protein kinase